MTETMMALGPFRFSIETAAYTALRRTHSYQWSQIERFKRAPALQFTGPGVIETEMSGRIYPHFRGGLGQIIRMNEVAAKGEPLLMVDGLGYQWGEHVITRVTENQQHIDGQGVPWRQDFSLRLISYGVDQ